MFPLSLRLRKAADRALVELAFVELEAEADLDLLPLPLLSLALSFLAGPWAHRTLIVRKLKGLEDFIGQSSRLSLCGQLVKLALSERDAKLDELDWDELGLSSARDADSLPYFVLLGVSVVHPHMLTKVRTSTERRRRGERTVEEDWL